MPSIAEIRKQYPQYNDLKDTELADAFHKNFYSDISKDEFYKTLGVKTPAIVDPLVGETNKAALESISSSIPEPVKEAAGAVADVAVQGFQALPAPVQSAARSTGNFILDTIDYLQRPFQAVAVGGKAVGGVLEKEGISTEDTGLFSFELPKLARAFSKEQNRKAVVEAAGRGFKGEEKASAQELLSDEFRKANPIKAALFGFAGDVLIDPLKGSVVAAPFKVAKETISAIPGATTIPSRLMDNELFRAINVTTGDVDKARELYNQYRYLRDKARNEGVRDAKALNNQFKALSKQSGIPVNELKAKLLHDIETGDLGDDALGQIESKIVSRNRELLEQQRAAGIDVGDLGETYMPHMISKEADEVLQLADKKNFFTTKPSSKNPQALKREIEGTINDINAKNMYGTTKYFEDDPALIIGRQEFQVANALAGKRFLTDVQELGVKADNAPRSYVSIDGIQGVKFDPAVANLVNRSYKLLTDDQAMNSFLKVYDGAQNWWKMWSLGVRPAYHAKNVVGNVWNAYLGGLSNPKTYGDAALFQTKLARNKLDGKVAGRPAEELYEEMAKRGVFGEGQYGGAEFARVLERQLEPIKATDLITPATSNVFLRAGFKVGQTLEDNARIALFLDQVKKGKSYDQAGKHVQKYMFDYGDVSPFERSTLKRIMPFYTWSRKNIPLQLEALVRHPDKINKLNLAINNIQQATGAQTPDPSEVPGYITAAGPVYVGQSESGEVAQAITLENLLPLMDLGPFTRFLNTKTAPTGPSRGELGETASSAMGPVSPFIKAPIEYFANYDFFRKKSIEEYKGQKVDMLGVEMPAHLAKTLSNIVLLSEVDRLNPGGIFGTRNVNPETGEITSTPSIFGVERESRIDLPEEQRQAQALTGVRIFDINKGQAEVVRMNKIKSDINALKGLLNKAAEKEKTREVLQAEAALEKFLTELDQVEEEIEARKKMKK
jgi:hypothetical protein